MTDDTPDAALARALASDDFNAVQLALMNEQEEADEFCPYDAVVMMRGYRLGQQSASPRDVVVTRVMIEAGGMAVEAQMSTDDNMPEDIARAAIEAALRAAPRGEAENLVQVTSKLAGDR